MTYTMDFTALAQPPPEGWTSNAQPLRAELLALLASDYASLYGKIVLTPAQVRELLA